MDATEMRCNSTNKVKRDLTIVIHMLLHLILPYLSRSISMDLEQESQSALESNCHLGKGAVDAFRS